MPPPTARRACFDAYVFDTLMPDLVGHDRSPAAFVVYLFLYRQRLRERLTKVRISHRNLAAETGLSKSAVQAAVRRLRARRLILSTRPSATAVPEYEVLQPWRR
ncbi:MAG: winged helix-turn-helix transcriptional regulator [Acidobacteriota bacterium]